MPVIEKIDDAGRRTLGEGPHWDPKTKTLYYVDIIEKSLHKYKPDTKEYSTAKVENTPSVIIPVENGLHEFIIVMDRKIVQIRWAEGQTQDVQILQVIGECDTEVAVQENRINDGKCDSTGRFWFGTMISKIDGWLTNKNMGTVYSFTPHEQLKKQIEGVDISNGIAFSADNKSMYYIDSLKKTIDSLDLDIINGTVSNRKIAFALETNKIDGIPDGMTIDADGNLWVAVFGGAKIIQIDPRRENCLLQSIELPANQITSVAFGGNDLSDLYVTTGYLPLGGKVSAEDGYLYRISQLGVKGMTPANIKL